ncbi:MAG: acyltransferase [Verrucomicrobia bacterium]|nr:acyltransferase [Verrucomicrobiota bacterium]
MKKSWRLLRHDWPLHFVQLFTNWLPDNVLFYRLRGWACRPFFGSCSKNLRFGRNVVFHNPMNIHLGRDVFIAYGSCLMANSEIRIADEVMLGPYCAIASGNHTRKNGSFRYGPAKNAPVSIGAGCWIGAHAALTAGVTIGGGSCVAAGAVVTKDAPSNVLVAGVPARIIKPLEDISIAAAAREATSALDQPNTF